ncbi:hypothetical protein N7507_001893 [Penicillium longicatenatum]|nr:hypothetical protein N7507_001893 [Penicillium longicatenatum]
MKSFLALTALAALCHSAYCFTEGTYKIGSASLDKTMVLTEVIGQEDLEFTKSNGHPAQIWDFTPDSSNAEYFVVTNNIGGFITCPELDSLCIVDEGEAPTSFRPEYVGGQNYELVAKGTGYFLHLAAGNKLKLAEYESGHDQEFVLTQT